MWLLGRLVDRSCDLRARVAALCSRWNFSRGLAGLPCAWASGYVSSMSGSWLLRSGVGSRVPGLVGSQTALCSVERLV